MFLTESLDYYASYLSGYWGYLIWMLPLIVLSALASGAVQSNYRKYSKVFSKRGLTGADVAEQILRSNGIHNVRVKQIAGNLSDHYHPKEQYIGLSEGVYGSTSVAALGIAAHEAGHAVQYHVGYGPIKFRGSLLPVANFASQFSWLLIFMGLLLSNVVALAGVILFGITVLFQLVTLPVEFNASRRALAVLEGGYLDEEELKGAKKVLTAAAMTYVVAALTALWQLFRYLLIIFGNQRRR